MFVSEEQPTKQKIQIKPYLYNIASINVQTFTVYWLSYPETWGIHSAKEEGEVEGDEGKEGKREKECVILT